MYQFKSRVRFSEVDSQLHMTLPSIINYFQDCSTFHSDSIGYGIEVMMEPGICLDPLFLADHHQPLSKVRGRNHSQHLGTRLESIFRLS